MMAGKRLRPLEKHQLLHRYLYTIDHGDTTYTVEFDAGEWKVQLYANGVSVATSDVPAKFSVPGGRIEVDSSLYGMSRVHLVLENGDERRLEPAPGTLEYRRRRLQRRHPRVSRAIGFVAIVVLLVNLVLAVPLALEYLTQVPRIAELVGTFTSPVQLPVWLNTALLIAGVIAAVERVLTLRRNRIIDAETIWTAF